MGPAVKDKDAVLAEIRAHLQAGTVTREDLQAMIGKPVVAQTAPVHEPAAAPATASSGKPDKLSAVDVMFYIAGIVLFAAIMSIIVQSWNDGAVFLQITLSLGVGAGLWAIACYLIRSPLQSDIRRGLYNALLLTGSMSIIAGGGIVTNAVVGGFNDSDFIVAAVASALVGIAHLGFDRLVKKDLILLLGVLLGVMAFPALIIGLLHGMDVPQDVWTVVTIASAALLAGTARLVARLYPGRQKIGGSFDSLAAFVALAAMYISSFGDYGLLWLAGLVAGVFGLFYLSIITQNKQMLGSGSFFLVLTVITASFKYFSGFGATTSLVLAALGLLLSAAVAATINKKYFKPRA